jgi:hypothetical protein
MDKKQALKIIQSNYEKIKEVLTCVHRGGYHKEYYNLIQDEEKSHRRFCPQGVTCGLTVSEAVKLFYVQRIVEALPGVHVPSIGSYLTCQKSWFFAHSLVANYKEELTKALQGVDFTLVNSLDYADLME